MHDLPMIHGPDTNRLTVVCSRQVVSSRQILGLYLKTCNLKFCQKRILVVSPSSHAITFIFIIDIRISLWSYYSMHHLHKYPWSHKFVDWTPSLTLEPVPWLGLLVVTGFDTWQLLWVCFCFGRVSLVGACYLYFTVMKRQSTS